MKKKEASHSNVYRSKYTNRVENLINIVVYMMHIVGAFVFHSGMTFLFKLLSFKEPALR